MKENKFMAAAMLASLLAGAAACSDGDEAAIADIPQPAPESQVVSDSEADGSAMISFVAGDGDCIQPIMKTAYASEASSSSSHEIVWVDGDNLYVYPVGADEDSKCAYASPANISGSSCELSIDEKYKSDYGYYAIYPANVGSQYVLQQDKPVFDKITIPGVQAVSEGQFDPKADFMVAYSKSSPRQFNFRHIGAKLGIKVPIEDVIKIEISCTDEIAGDASVDLAQNPDAVPELKGISNGSKMITLTCNGGFKKDATYYACLLPTSEATTLKIVMHTKNSANEESMYIIHAGIAAMERATRSQAEPPAGKMHKGVVVDPTQLKDPYFPSDVTKIVFGYLSQQDEQVKAGAQTIQEYDMLYQYQKGTECYILSDAEMCIDYCNQLFQGYTSLTEIDLINFNVDLVSEFGFMFNGCTNLKTIYATEDFNVSGTVPMFRDCTSLIGGKGTKYDPNETSSASPDRARIDKGSAAPGYFTMFKQQ